MQVCKNICRLVITFDKFDNADASANAVGKIGSKKVLPTISDDLKKGALQATIFAIDRYLPVYLHPFPRLEIFTGYDCSIAARRIGNTDRFLFCPKSIVPFPLEIDQHFIAALIDGDRFLDE